MPVSTACMKRAASRRPHAGRKFYDLHQAHASPLAAEAMARIAQLYGIETEIRGRSPGERLDVRQTRARPLLESLHEWLQDSLAKLSAKSETSSAVRYALGRWAALMRYCEDGRLEIDNNAAERALRAVALGRKNYLFAGSDAGGGDVQPDRLSQAERAGPGGLLARRAHPHRRPPDQPDCGTAAMERRSGRDAGVPHRLK